MLESMAIATLGASRSLRYSADIQAPALHHGQQYPAPDEQLGRQRPDGLHEQGEEGDGRHGGLHPLHGGVRGEEDPCSAGDHPPGLLRPRRGDPHPGGHERSAGRGECPVRVHPSCGLVISSRYNYYKMLLYFTPFFNYNLVSSLQLPNGLGKGEDRVMHPPKHDTPNRTP